MKSTDHAMHEFEILGWPGDDNLQKFVCDSVMALLERVFEAGS